MCLIEFNNNELILIDKALKLGCNCWSADFLSDIKEKIKNHLLKKQLENCCYCQKNLSGEFSMVIDIEHILPKSKYPKFMFDLRNLAISCKRCNMKIKRNDIAFLNDVFFQSENYFDTKGYDIVHPNLDVYDNHLKLYGFQCGSVKLIKYIIVDNSRKGDFTYGYFKLKELEVNTFNNAQGLSNESDIIDEVVNEMFVKATEKFNMNY